MSVKIRLQRHGRKKSAFFHIVVADSRAPRNGKFIEKLGSYNPNTNPATIDLNFDSTLNWVQKGAIPSDTCRAILSYKGVMMKHHLLNGVGKGAHTAEQAEDRFNAWLNEKTEKITTKESTLGDAKQSKRLADLARETKISQERAAKIAERNAPIIEVAPVEEAAAEVSAEVTETVETAVVETPVAEAPVEVAAAVEETPVAEAPVEVTEAPEEVKNTAEETPAADAPAEEEAK